MNSIIKQINYEQSKQILGVHGLAEFINDELACVFFIADWSVPSRLICKRLKKMPCTDRKIGFIDVDLVDNISLCDRYEIKSVPHCLVFEKNQKIYQFVGMDIQKLNEALLKIKTKLPTKQEKVLPTKCPNSHPLQVKSSLQSPPYVNDYFYCNECKKIEHCSKESQVYHCGECDYDLCQNCTIGWKQK